MRQPILHRHRGAKFGGERRVGRRLRLASQPAVTGEAPQIGETLFGGSARGENLGARRQYQPAGGTAPAPTARVRPIEPGSLDGGEQRLVGGHVHGGRRHEVADGQARHLVPENERDEAEGTRNRARKNTISRLMKAISTTIGPVSTCAVVACPRIDRTRLN